jgi:type II secretory pathway component PulK
MKNSRKTEKHGFILVTALWIILIISVVTVLVSYRTSLQLKSLAAECDRAEAGFITRGILTKIAYDISNRENKSIIKMADPFFSPDYKPLQDELFLSYNPVISISDEEGFINLNNSPKEFIINFFRQFELSDNAASCLLDWIDPDSDSTNNGDGAESDYYSGLDDGYLCKNSALSAKEEIAFIKEIGPKSREIMPFFTVFGDGKININTAEKSTLGSMGFTGQLIEKIASYRLGSDLTPFTADDRFFETPQGIIANLQNFCYLLPDEINMINSVLDKLKTSSAHFRIKISIDRKRTRSPYSIEAVVAIDKGNWEMVQWKEL